MLVLLVLLVSVNFKLATHKFPASPCYRLECQAPICNGIVDQNQGSNLKTVIKWFIFLATQ